MTCKVKIDVKAIKKQPTKTLTTNTSNKRLVEDTHLEQLLRLDKYHPLW